MNSQVIAIIANPNIYKDNFGMIWLGVATTSFLAKLHNLHPQWRPLSLF